MDSDQTEEGKLRRRKRGLVLSARGFARLNLARRALEHERNAGARFSLERLSVEIGLSAKTLAKVLGRSAPVDLRTLECIFANFGLQIDEGDHESLGGGPQFGALSIGRTPLVGRASEMRRVRELLAAHRIVTLTGSGGIGKTRLAIELAKTIVPPIADKVVYVDLSSLVDAAMVASAVLGAFGLSEPRHRAVETLASVITSEVVCFIDNCEHLLSAVADFTDRALAAIPFLRFLATSREPLGIAGERVVRIGPLALPEPDTNDVVEALRSPAVKLFVERTTAFEDAFVFEPRLVPHVVDIVRRLDGLPLAIELAAARSDVLALPELRKSLSERLDLLGDDRASFAMRHRSVRALVDWSYRLLSPEERTVFRGCAAFMGDFDIAAASAVIGVPSVEAIAGRLVRKSLVVRAPDTESTRLVLLELVRHVALEELRQAGEATAIRAAHARYFAGLARDQTRRLQTSERATAVATLKRDESNLREALEWSLQSSQAGDIAIELAGDLADYWDAREASIEGEEWLERAVAGADLGKATVKLAKALAGLALMRFRNGHVKSSIEAAEQSVAMSEELGDRSAAEASRRVLELAETL